MHRLILGLVLLLAAAPPAAAAPLTYLLDRDASSVAFEVDFGDGRISGQMPVASADMRLDFERPAASTVEVALDVRRARASPAFATGAMTGASVLDAARHPQITFASTGFRATGPSSAEVDGIVTIRGVSRPVTLGAQFFRPQGVPPGDRSSLIIRLRTTVDRSDFGATGYADLVGDDVQIDIRAKIGQAK